MPGYKRTRPSGRRYVPSRSAKSRRGRTGRPIYKRKARAYASRQMARPSMMRTIAPQIYYTKLHMGDTWALSAATPGTTNWVRFHANNAYDPRAGASTSKCSGYDQLLSIYHYLVVKACKISVGFVQTTDNSVEVYGYSQFEPSTNNLNRVLTPDELTESRVQFTRKRIVSSPMHNNQLQPVWVKNYVAIKTLERNFALDPAQYRQWKSGGPAVNTYINVGYQTTGSAEVVSSAVRALVRITYYCKLFERLPMGS